MDMGPGGGVSGELRRIMMEERVTYKDVGNRLGCSPQNAWAALCGSGKRKARLGTFRAACEMAGCRISVMSTDGRELWGELANIPGIDSVQLDTAEQMARVMGCRMSIKKTQKN